MLMISLLKINFNTIKLVLAMAHLELGELKLSDITRRLLTQVD